MQYVITGSAGTISKPLVNQLLNAGHKVTVIGRNEQHLNELVQAGAQAAIGSVEDSTFLKKTFAGADAAYTMCPPNVTTNDLKGFYEQLGTNYAAAIKENNIRYVVNLSSIGAHLAQGAGPASGLHRTEQALNTLHDVHVRHLRPAYFYTNLFATIDLIKNMGIIGNNFSKAANRFPVVDPGDVAAAAAEELLSWQFTGHSVRYIASDETGTDAIAAAIGNAIGMPQLRWVKFADELVYQQLLHAGFSPELASVFVELGTAIDGEKMWEDYWKHHPLHFGKIKLNDFANKFASVYIKAEPTQATASHE